MHPAGSNFYKKPGHEICGGVRMPGLVISPCFGNINVISVVDKSNIKEVSHVGIYGIH